jgi:hypothetical protein
MTAFVPCRRGDLDLIFSIQTDRTVNKDNTVSYRNMSLQIDKQSWRGSMAGSQVVVYQHLDTTISLGFGPHIVGRFSSNGEKIKPSPAKRSVGKSVAVPPPTYQPQTGHLMFICY